MGKDSRRLQRGMLLQRFFVGGIWGGNPPEECHETVSKESGELAHVERWKNTLGQRLARLVRKTLSLFFSKSDEMHEVSL